MDNASVPTLDDLALALGAPDPALVEAVVTQSSRDELIARGATVASSRVIVDVSRIYGLAHAVWGKATPEQQDALVGFSPELLGIAVDRAVALRDLTSDTEDAGHADTVSVEVRSAAATAAFSQGLSRRDHLHTVLRTVAGPDPELRSRVDVAVGTADDADALSKGMMRLVAIGQELLALPAGPIALRAKLARLTSDYLDSIKTLANKVQTTGRAATGRATARRVAQGDIDFLDGVNLHLLSLVIGAFEAAHDVDGTIPRLTPIATRRALGKNRRSKAEKGNGNAEEKGGAGKGSEGEGGKPA